MRKPYPQVLGVAQNSVRRHPEELGVAQNSIRRHPEELGVAQNSVRRHPAELGVTSDGKNLKVEDFLPNISLSHHFLYLYV